MGVISRAEWGAAAPDVTRIANRDPHTITVGVVHYSDAAAVDDIRPPDSPEEHEQVQQVRAIQRFHMDVRGWADIAYHWLIAPDGTVFAGRPVGQVGAHAAGHNTDSVGYCLLSDGPVTDEQKDALRRQIDADRAPLGLAYARVVGHRSLDPTACPGDTIAEWVDAGMPAPSAPLPEPGPATGTCADLPPGPPPEGRTLLAEGATGAEVIDLQERLSDAGYPPDGSKTKRGTWDGKFGPKTAAAVAALQADNGLAVDGKVGRQTWCALGIR